VADPYGCAESEDSIAAGNSLNTEQAWLTIIQEGHFAK
jgi:hypothetical protein